jgi:hypothetical protein
MSKPDMDNPREQSCGAQAAHCLVAGSGWPVRGNPSRGKTIEAAPGLDRQLVGFSREDAGRDGLTTPRRIAIDPGQLPRRIMETLMSGERTQIGLDHRDPRNEVSNVGFDSGI